MISYFRPECSRPEKFDPAIWKTWSSKPSENLISDIQSILEQEINSIMDMYKTDPNEETFKKCQQEIR